MVWSFNDHLVCADPLHLVEKTFAFTIELAMDLKDGILIRHDADLPSGLVGRSAIAECEDFFGGAAFIAGAERTSRVGCRRGHGFTAKVTWPPGSISGDNHPSIGDGVFT